MTYFNENTHELKDKKIIAALKQALKDYEDGAIIECRDELADIVNAIDAFDEWEEQK